MYATSLERKKIDVRNAFRGYTQCKTSLMFVKYGLLVTRYVTSLRASNVSMTVLKIVSK